MEIVIQHSAINSHKVKEMLILTTPILLLTTVILKWSYRKKYANRNNFLTRIMWFFEWRTHVISYHSVKVNVHRTCGNGDVAIYDHVIKESCDFVREGPISQAITLLSLVAMGFEEIEIYFIFVTWLLCDVTFLAGDPFP